MRTLLVAAALAVSGCATIDQHTPPPADWPAMKITEHRVSYLDVLSKCYATLSLAEKLIGSVPLACAWFNLEARTCDIYLTTWAPASVVEHEYEHCAGKDHVGSTHLADHLRRYREAGGR